MPTTRITYILLSLISVTAYFLGRELVGKIMGVGVFSIAMGMLLGVYLARQLAHRSSRTQWIATAGTVVVCAGCLFGAVWYTQQRTTQVAHQLLGTWEASDAKGSLLLEVKADSTYLTDTNTGLGLRYSLRPSVDSLILLHETGSHWKLPLVKLTANELVVGEGSDELTFHKRN